MMNRHELLREARSRAGLTGREVAHRVNLPEARIPKLEGGKQGVTEETLRRYYAASLITADELVAMVLGDAA